MEATGASHVKVMVVVPVAEIVTDLGGSGLGGAKNDKDELQIKVATGSQFSTLDPDGTNWRQMGYR